jgi:hypothetical protein
MPLRAYGKTYTYTARLTNGYPSAWIPPTGTDSHPLHGKYNGNGYTIEQRETGNRRA